MPEIIKEAIVPYSNEAMFNLVLDIESYPLFLPWCPKVQIHHQAPNETDATIFVQKSFMSFSFRTRNINKPSESIQMFLVEGPFKTLQGLWEFSPLGEPGLEAPENEAYLKAASQACKVKFSLSYIFANRALDMTLNPMMQKLADSFLDAFCQQAGKSAALSETRT